MGEGRLLTSERKCYKRFLRQVKVRRLLMTFGRVVEDDGLSFYDGLRLSYERKDLVSHLILATAHLRILKSVHDCKPQFQPIIQIIDFSS